jgi:hypothetical protein
MRYSSLSAVIASSFFVLPSVCVASASGWQPATATSVVAGASHSSFIVQAAVTLPQSCDAARIRSTPISLHTPRSFYIEQLPPSSPCKGTTVYKCTVVSPAFPLPIPHMIEVTSKGPQKWKVPVQTEEPTATPPLCPKG